MSVLVTLKHLSGSCQHKHVQINTYIHTVSYIFKSKEVKKAGKEGRQMYIFTFITTLLWLPKQCYWDFFILLLNCCIQDSF